MFRIEVVVPVHNRREITLQFLRSLSRIDASSLIVHVIVVDDGSTDGTSDAIKDHFPEVQLIRGDGNLWYTEGTNVAIRAALEHGPNYILAVNDDSVFDGKFLQYLVETAESNSRSVVGPLLLDWDTPHKVFQIAPYWDTWLGGIRHWRHQTIWTVPKHVWEVDVIVGNCVLYPVEAVREAGLMDSRRLRMWGDAEYTPRLKRLGWQLLIDPRARVFCKPNDITSGFRTFSVMRKLKQLILDPYGPYSIRRRYYVCLGLAPSWFHALISVPIFYVRAFLGRNIEGSWADQLPEEPLANIIERAK